MAKREKKKRLKKKKKESVVLEEVVGLFDNILSTKSLKVLTNSKKNEYIKKIPRNRLWQKTLCLKLVQ